MDPLITPTVDSQDGSPIDKKARQWGMIAHVTGLSIFLGIPFGNILGPLMVWLFKKDSHPFVDECGKEALNFQICWTLYGAIAGLLCFVLIGFVLLPILLVLDIVFTIKATLRADKGQSYLYPFTIRFLK